MTLPPMARLVVTLWPNYILAIKVATAVIACKQALLGGWLAEL